MIKINNEKCIGCLKCVEVCPFTVLDVVDGKPKLNEKKNCLRCMHCAATCEVSAITYGEESAVLEKEIKKLPENFAEMLENHIMARRSYRHFDSTPVDRGVLEGALKAACWAASAKNQQGTKYVVVDTREVIDKIMEDILTFARETGAIPEVVAECERGNNPIMGNAPTLLLAYAPEADVNPLGDTFLKLASIELLLQAQGIGSCFGGYLARLSNNVPVLKELFALPEGNSFYGALMLGYPKGENYSRIPERLQRQEIKWL